MVTENEDALHAAIRSALLTGGFGKGKTKRQARKRVRTWNVGSTVADSLGQLIWLALVAAFLEAWGLMLLLGMFAGYLAIPGLALGYWACMGSASCGAWLALR